MRSESLKALLSRGSYAVLAFALVAEASAAETRINVERPKQDEVVSGVTNVYGWALGDPYLDVLEVAVDDGPFKGLPYGGEREDVHQVFPGYPFSDDSGFALTVNTRELGNGPHEITIRADNGVEVAEKTVRFVVSNPPGAPGEDNPAKLRVDLSGATVSVVGTDSLFIEGMLVDGQSVNTVVSFSRASNAFVMSSFQYDSNRDGVFDDDLDEDGFHDDDANGDGLHDHQKVKGTVVSVAAGPVVREGQHHGRGRGSGRRHAGTGVRGHGRGGAVPGRPDRRRWTCTLRPGRGLDERRSGHGLRGRNRSDHRQSARRGVDSGIQRRRIRLLRLLPRRPGAA